MSTENQHRGRKFAGDLFARKAGSTGGYTKIGNITSLNISREIETDELQGTGKHNFGQAIESVTKPKPSEIEIKFNTFDKQALARTLMGEAVLLNQTVETITDEALKADLNTWQKLAKNGIDVSTVTVKNASNQPVDKSHYQIEPDAGLILFSDGVSQGEALKISYKTVALNGFTVEADTVQRLDLELMLNGIDRITGKKGILEIHHAVLKSDGSQDWLSDDWWEAGISGTLLKPENQASAYRYKEF